jgi:hypothetical protein
MPLGTHPDGLRASMAAFDRKGALAQDLVSKHPHSEFHFFLSESRRHRKSLASASPSSGPRSLCLAKTLRSTHVALLH